MVSFDRSYTTEYLSAIVTIVLSCTFFEPLSLNDIIMTLVTVHSRSLETVPFVSLGAVSYSFSIVTMALSCVISEMKRDVGRKSLFFGILPDRLV